MKYILIFAILIGFTSCDIGDDGDVISVVNYNIVGSGDLFGAGEEDIEQQNSVITNEADWLALQEKMNSVNNTTDNFFVEDIDFNEFQLIAIFDQVRSTGGYGIGLQLLEANNTITAQITYQSPSGGSNQVITQPFLIVAIQKTTLPIEFQLNNNG